MALARYAMMNWKKMMRMKLKSGLTACLKLVLVCATAVFFHAAPIHAAEEDTDPVFVFNRICYAQVPNLDSIRNMSRQLAWRPITGEDLNGFTTIKNPTVLEGWDAQVGVRLYRVAIVQSPLTAKMKETFPSFAGGTATSCMIVLDEQNPAKYFNANMQKLAGKAPVSKNVPDGDLLTTTWAGGNDDLKVFLISKANIGGQGGLLNVTVLAK